MNGKLLGHGGNHIWKGDGHDDWFNSQRINQFFSLSFWNIYFLLLERQRRQEFLTWVVLSQTLGLWICWFLGILAGSKIAKWIVSLRSLYMVGPFSHAILLYCETAKYHFLDASAMLFGSLIHCKSKPKTTTKKSW